MKKPRMTVPPRGSPTVGDLPTHVTTPHKSILKRLGYGLISLSIYVVHAVCALYCFVAARFFHEIQMTAMIGYLELYEVIISPRFFPAFAIAHYIMGGIHVCMAVEPLIRTVYAAIPFRRRPCPRSTVPSRVASLLPSSLRQHILPSVIHNARVISNRVFSPTGFLGIESQYFDIQRMVREALECGLQTYQAYQMCQHLSRLWLNRLFVGALVTKCWIPVLVHHGVANTTLQRLLNRLVDALLDILALIGVPLALVASYWHDYDPVLHSFPSQIWFDEAWTIRFRMESPIVFFRTWIHVLCRLALAFGFLLTLNDIKYLVAKLRSRLSTIHPQPLMRTTTPRTTRLVRLGRFVLFAFGIGVLIIHSYAELRTPPSPCMLPMWPWFASKPTCALIEINCYTNRAFNCDATAFNKIFYLNAASLEYVTFRHCHNIVVQPVIQTFPNLVILVFYNTTISEWNERAALTTTTHPKLESLIFYRTVFPDGVVPDGLLSRSFPGTVLELTMSFSNLKELPDDLDERWPSGIILCLEFSQLTAYPNALTKMQPYAIALTQNLISDVPAAAFEQPGLYLLGLSNNPITQLPETVNIPLSDSLITLQMDGTNLSTLPEWVLELVTSKLMSVVVGNTPYCESILDLDNGSHVDSTTDTSISCGNDGFQNALLRLGWYVRNNEVW